MFLSQVFEGLALLTPSGGEARVLLAPGASYRVTSNRYRVTSNRYRVTSNRYRVTSNRYRVTSKRYRVTSNSTCLTML